MITKITDGITSKIRESYLDAQIYTTPVNGLIPADSFYIMFLSDHQKKLMGGRYRRSTQMIVQFIPSKKKVITEELVRMGENLIDLLEFITLREKSTDNAPFEEGIVMGDDMYQSIVDGTLQVNVTYVYQTIKLPANHDSSVGFMERLVHTIDTKSKEE